MFFIIAETNFGTDPDSQYCAQVRDAFGLTMPVLYDPTGSALTQFVSGGKNDWSFVLDAAGVTQLKQKYAGSAAWTKVDQVLGQ